LEAVKQNCATLYPGFTCPSRRQAKPYPFTHKPTANDGKTSFYTSGLFCDASGKSLLAVAKTDYAGNGGQHFFTADTLPGEKMCDAGGPVGAAVPPAADPYALFDTAIKDDKPIRDGTDRWKLTPKEGIAKFAEAADGIFYPFSLVKVDDIVDGTSNTYLCGEKALSSDHYEDGLDDGDDQCVWMGHDKDIVRWAENETTGQLASSLRDLPTQKAPPGANSLFGSAHAGGFNVAMCDGAVRQISYKIDSTVHACLANRRDGQKINLSELSF
jgi:prepilin-type processing-associated H-X9-DG protein